MVAQDKPRKGKSTRRNVTIFVSDRNSFQSLLRMTY